ncbi:hypothetical protein [Spirosoma flavum]|uniref:Uncharacterized protein n=1 Tax=Spirosoma flavum TaxID=2048557 RepID=A0ABW6AK41_9BACT
MMLDKNKKPQKKLGQNRGLHHVNSTLAVTPFTSGKEKKFSAVSKIKIFKDNELAEGKVKYKIVQLQEREKTTASDTFVVNLQKGIGSGSAKTSTGIAKKRADLDNVSASNLGLNLKKGNPRMLARQIASWKVARNLNMRVLSNEKYALDEDGEIHGISSMLPATSMSIKDLLSDHQKIMTDAKLDDNTKQNYLGNVIFSGKIQKELSDLQLLDALTGQTDRHHGNIFIDLINQSVHGIDNDQAFGTKPMKFNDQNAVGSFKIYTNDPKKGAPTRTYDTSRGLEFTQTQIDINTAEKMLAMSEMGLEKLLIDRSGAQHGEFLTKEEVDMAKVRLNAIKIQIQKLKEAGSLIKSWDETTYNDAVGGGLAVLYEGLKMDIVDSSQQKYQSYVAREVNKIAHNKNQYGITYPKGYIHH